MNRNVRMVVAGTAGLALGLGAGFVVGSSETRTTTETVASTRVPTRPATPPATAPPPTQAAPSAPSAPSATAQRQPPKARAERPKARSGQRFSGTGNRRLGTVTVAKPSILSWSSAGERFEIRYAAGSVAVASVAKAGSIPVPPGIYPAVRVAASARWQIKITPL